MREAGIGRVLVASLHEAISDLMPTRLDFYEHWLSPDDLRLGTFGLAPLNAVLSFLREEGEAYGSVMARAGTYAADWLLAGRRLHGSLGVLWLPAGIRARAAVRTVRRLIRACYRDNRATIRLRRGAGTLEIRGSVFCTVREPVAAPLCGFYQALAGRVLQAYGLDATARVEACRATGAPACQLAVAIDLRRKPGQAVEASQPGIADRKPAS